MVTKCHYYFLRGYFGHLLQLFLLYTLLSVLDYLKCYFYLLVSNGFFNRRLPC
jgi:hypothetical protein